MLAAPAGAAGAGPANAASDLTSDRSNRRQPPCATANHLMQAQVLQVADKYDMEVVKERWVGSHGSIVDGWRLVAAVHCLHWQQGEHLCMGPGPGLSPEVVPAHAHVLACVQAQVREVAGLAVLARQGEGHPLSSHPAIFHVVMWAQPTKVRLSSFTTLADALCGLQVPRCGHCL